MGSPQLHQRAKTGDCRNPWSQATFKELDPGITSEVLAIVELRDLLCLDQPGEIHQLKNFLAQLRGQPAD